MRRNSYIGSAGVSGGGALEGIGQIKWFAASDLIPEGWEPADGGGLDPSTSADFIASTGANGAAWQVGNYGLSQWRTSTSYVPLIALGRSMLIVGDLVVRVMRDIGTSSGYMFRDQLAVNTNFNEINLQSVNFPAAPRTFGYIPEDKYMLVMCSAGLYGCAIDVPGRTPTLLSTITETMVPDNQIVKVGGKYITGTSTKLLVCDGPGSWGTWAQVAPVGMVFGITDILSVKIAGVQTGIILCWNGDIWTTTDAVTFTKLPLKHPGTVSAGSYKQNSIRLVHDGVDTFWFLNRLGGGVYKSTDLQTWTQFADLSTLGSVSAIDAGGGMVSVGNYYGSDVLHPNPMLRYSPDKGATWITTLVGNLWSYATYSVEGCPISGAGMYAYQYNGQNGPVYSVKIGLSKPKYRDMLLNGERFSAYVKVA